MSPCLAVLALGCGSNAGSSAADGNPLPGEGSPGTVSPTNPAVATNPATTPDVPAATSTQPVNGTEPAVATMDPTSTATSPPATTDATPPTDAGNAVPPTVPTVPTERCVAGAPGAFFIDAVNGDDAATGDQPDAAWQTLDRVNAQVFEPGNSLCFRAGQTFTGQLAPQGSGTADQPIVIDQFETGARPRIDAGPDVLDTVLLFNVEYWELNHLEITNDKGGPGDVRGIALRGQDVGQLNHIYVRDSYIHDVTGVVNWIGGDVADNEPPWITFQTGWDASKRTGGIVVEVASVNGTPTWFNDVVLERNVIQDTSFGGIIFKQLDGGYGWGIRNSLNDTRFTPHTNVVLRDNYLTQTNTPFGANTIYVTGVQGVLIEGNVTVDSGTSAIEVYNVDDVLIQSNETRRTIRKANGADFNGIDADRASTNVTIQYNYVHDNGDGILLAQFAFGSSVVRYNVIANNSRYGINLHSDAAATNQTYNNLFFVDGLGGASLVNTSGDGTHLNSPYTLSNNIFFTTSTTDAARTGSGVVYDNNLYSGIPVVAGDARALTGDPLFVDASTLGDGNEGGPAFASLVGFALQPGSPALGSGVAIPDNGGLDFTGEALYQGAPDVGPFEAE